MSTKIENKYNVPSKVWNKLSDKSKIVYNNIRIQGKMEYMSHPKAKISIDEWDTISHNFAILAAFELK